MTTKTINPAYEDRQPIVDALLGRRIVAISGIEPGRDQMGEGMLALDDGTFLTLEGHDGGCSCTAGCYWLKHLAGLGDVDNVITAVEFVDSPDSDDHDGGEPLVYELSDVEGELIADARSSLPLALDALEAVLARHRPVSYAATANCGLVLYEVCPTCHDKAGVHPCGCWRDEDQIHICAECNKVWPCATAEAIETALAGGCGQCRQIDGHHKLDCGRRTS